MTLPHTGQRRDGELEGGREVGNVLAGDGITIGAEPHAL